MIASEQSELLKNRKHALGALGVGVFGRCPMVCVWYEQAHRVGGEPQQLVAGLVPPVGATPRRWLAGLRSAPPYLCANVGSWD